MTTPGQYGDQPKEFPGPYGSGDSGGHPGQYNPGEPPAQGYPGYPSDPGQGYPPPGGGYPAPGYPGEPAPGAGYPYQQQHPGQAPYPGQPYPGAGYGPPAGYGGGFDPSAPYGRHPLTGEPFSDKQKLTAGLLQILLGYVGAGRWYMGDVGIALAQLFTCGGLGIWALIDGIMILTGNVRDKNGLPLRD